MRLFCSLEKPVVPMTIFFFNFFAKFKISKQALGLEKSMIMSVFLNASILFLKAGDSD